MTIATAQRTEKSKPDLPTEERQPDLLTETLLWKIGNRECSSDIDLHAAATQVLKDVGLSTLDSGRNVTVYGRDPIIPSPHRFGSMAAIGLAAKAVAVAALWRYWTDEGQDIAVDVRKALRRSCDFFDLNGKPSTDVRRRSSGIPSTRSFALPLFRETRDGRHVNRLFRKLSQEASRWISIPHFCREFSSLG